LNYFNEILNDKLFVESGVKHHKTNLKPNQLIVYMYQVDLTRVYNTDMLIIIITDQSDQKEILHNYDH